MATNLMGELVANRGTFIVNNTAQKTVNIDAIVVLEDTVFSGIEIAGIDVKSSYIAATGTAVKAGAILTPQGTAVFNAVKLISGSVALVLA